MLRLQNKCLDLGTRQYSESLISGASFITLNLPDLDHCAADRERKTDHQGKSSAGGILVSLFYGETVNNLLGLLELRGVSITG